MGDRPEYRLAHNENPHAPAEEVAAALHATITEVNRYPEFRPERLTGLLAEWQDVPPASVAVGQGAGGVAHDLFRALLRPGDNVVSTAPGFDLYPMLCAMTDTNAVTVPMDAGGHNDLTALAESIDDRTRLVIVCNPHNPTGTLADWARLTAFFERVPVHVTILLDEAYIDFAPDFDGPSARDRLAAWPNLVILRTFSKSHALAALRVGYALASAALVERIRSHQLPFGMNQFQLDAVRAALGAEHETRERIADLVNQRDRVRTELLRLGWTVPDSRANFLWLADAERVEPAVAALTRAGVAVRPYPGRGIRLTVGRKQDNDAVLAALSEV
ncbi:pyridoxal phosphate-dependent aminotransferase [Streptomyces sp. NPDC059717]|uniref:pyridoxal phosphate-dependent aminotransferase n=1 Tax=Streptomyces sp. NPDC059717 TaxID=3346922 RepID=UPI0036935348